MCHCIYFKIPQSVSDLLLRYEPSRGLGWVRDQVYLLSPQSKLNLKKQHSVFMHHKLKTKSLLQLFLCFMHFITLNLGLFIHISHCTRSLYYLAFYFVLLPFVSFLHALWVVADSYTNKVASAGEDVLLLENRHRRAAVHTCFGPFSCLNQRLSQQLVKDLMIGFSC